MFDKIEELSIHLRRKEDFHGTVQHCSHCNLVFYSTKAYQNHIFTKHTGNRSQCPICGIAVKHACNFRRHVLSHFVEKRFCCAECGCCFTRKDSMKKHLEKQHIKQAQNQRIGYTTI